MDVIRKYMKVDISGSLLLEGLPFSDGELVEVLVLPMNENQSDLTKRWFSMFKQLQSRDNSIRISDNEILDEIENFRKL
jgi:hypothetical protein